MNAKAKPKSPSATPATTAAKERARAAAELRELGAQAEQQPMMAELHRRAEVQVKKLGQQQGAAAAALAATADPQRLLHELQVHQVELEMQNEELRKVRDQLEAGLEKYTDLYDFAPVGYFTLTADGCIQQVNLTGASLAGMERARLVGQRFGLLVAAEQRSDFNAFLQQVFASQAKESGDFALLTPGQPPKIVRIRAKLSSNRQECCAVLVDITERKAAEGIVRHSEIRYRRLFEAAHDGVLLLDPMTRKITEANPFMTQLLGYPHEQLVGKELFEIGLLKDKAASQEMFRKLKRKHEVRYEDLPLASREGRQQEVEVVANLYQENGQAVIQCNIRDITARKEAQAALHQSEERLRLAIAGSNLGTWHWDIRTGALDWSERCRNIFGIPPRTVMSYKKFLGALHRADRARADAAVQRAIRDHSEYRIEFRSVWPDGSVHWAVSIGRAYYDAAGKPTRMEGIAFDITDRKRAEETLAERTELLNAVLQGTTDVIFVKDLNGRCLMANAAAAAVLGSTPEQMLGKTDAELCPPDLAAAIRKHDRAVIAGGSPIQIEETFQVAGEARVFLTLKAPLRDGSRRVIGILGSSRDITERKLSEAAQLRLAVLTASHEELTAEIVRRQAVEETLRHSERQQTRLLEEARQLQEQLRQLSRQVLRAQEEERKRISRELHDVVAQTLAGINVRLTALQKEAARNPAGLADKLARTQLLVEKSVDLVHQFARELRPTMLDDLGLIPALHAFLKSFTTRTGVRTSLTAFAEIEQLDTAPRTMLYRVAQEALTNVGKHAHASRVAVSLQKLPTAVRMEMKDDGQSFAVDRVLKAQKNQRLGLIGMRERVEMVGGKFAVTSAPGQGTSIQVELPFTNGDGGKGV